MNSQNAMKIIEYLKSKDNLLNLPNLLTIIRLILIPLMIIFLEYDSEQVPFERDFMFRYSPGKLAAIVVIIAGITDLLDGYFARKWKIETILGKFLDPVVDKVFLMVGLIMLLKLGRIEAWLVILLLLREFLITGLRTVAVGEGLVMAAGKGGKFKLVFQLVGIGFCMWYGSAFGIPAIKVGKIILYVALVISFLSGYNYLSEFFCALNKKRNSINQ